MSEIEMIFPAGAFGPSGYDTPIDHAMRLIAVEASPNYREEWAEKYGTTIDNDVFLMHPYCWCEEDSCSWCGGECECPPGAFHYFVDGNEVSYEAWMSFYMREVYGRDYEPGDISHLRAPQLANPDVVNARRSTSHDPMCDYCTKGHGVDRGGVPGHSAPNFWHKPSGFRVWWYKYIGRGVETHGEPPADLVEQCLRALA